jgi:AAA domain
MTRNGKRDHRQPSGHYPRDDDDPKPIHSRVKRRAEDIARREVGAADDWERFIDQAEGEVDWESFEKWFKEQGWKPVATYDYKGPDGKLLYQAIRFQYELFPSKKRFILRHRIKDGKWIHDSGPVRVPYNLPELLKHPDDPVTLVEGEKGADFLKDKGVLASCIQGQNWSGDIVQFFAGRTVNVAMDNDDAGRANAKDAIEWLGKVGATIRIISLPGLGPGDGLDDWLVSHDLAEYDAIVAKTKAELPGAIGAVPHQFPDERTLPQWDFLYGKHLMRKTVSATVATGATGKSSMSIVEALAMATGKPLLRVSVARYEKVDPEEIDPELLAKIKSAPSGGLSKDAFDNPYRMAPLRVLLINLEDNREAIDKRIAAAMKHYKLTPADVGNRLFTIAKGELSFKIAAQARSGVVTRNDAAINNLTAFLIENQIDVLSIDPFIATHSVNENDNTAIRNVIECYDTIAESANCAVSIWHHTRKANGADASIDSARGAGAFIDACRSVRVLETMGQKQAKELGITGNYFRSFSGKLNFAPPSEESDWFHFVDVGIDNAWPFGDRVGVVAAWDHPLKGGKAIDLSMDEISKIRHEITSSGEWREDQRADMWAGKAIAAALNIDGEEKLRLKSILSKLILTKVLRRVMRKDRSRRERTYIESA